MDPLTLGILVPSTLLLWAAVWLFSKHMAIKRPSHSVTHGPPLYVPLGPTEDWDPRAHLLVHMILTAVGLLGWAAALGYHLERHQETTPVSERLVNGVGTPLIVLMTMLLLQAALFEHHRRAWMRVVLYLLLLLSFALLGVQVAQQRRVVDEAMGTIGAGIAPLAFIAMLETGHTRKWAPHVAWRVLYCTGWFMMAFAAVQEMDADRIELPAPIGTR